MAKYYFHVRGPAGFIEDIEGIEFASQGEAHTEAIVAARELVADMVWDGRDIEDDVIEVTTEAGQILEKVGFHAAVRLI